MRSIYFFVLVLGLSIFSSESSYAAHIVGGDVTYDCLGLDTLNNGTEMIDLRITFNMYRDSQSGGAQFDNPARFGVYSFDGNDYTFVQALQESIDVQSDVSLDTDNPCVIFPPNVGVERAEYVFTLRLPVLKGIDERYAVVYQRCCRNGTISNLIDPQSTGAAFMIEITSLAMSICNDSPVFDNFPPVVICSGVDIDFNHSASDNEGHQIFYEFCAPLTGGGTDGATTPGNANDCTGVTPDPSNCPPPYDEVLFQLPNYSPTNPLGGDPQVSINSITGLITGVPQINGQYVVGVCAREIYNGQIMTVIRRDFQFNVTTCEIAVTAQIEPQGDAQVEDLDVIIDGVPSSIATITSCGEEAIDFEHVGPDDDILSYLWVADFKNGTVETASTPGTQFTFPGAGDYSVLLVTNEGLQCEARDSFPVKIYPGLFPNFAFDYDTCVAGPVVFEDLSLPELNQTIEEWNWDFNGFDTSIDENPNFLFPEPGNHPVTLNLVDENGCENTLTINVDWFPAPPILTVAPNRFEGCVPSDIFFNNLSTPIDSTYDILWDFGDGNTGTDISPTHTYEEVGVYNVSLSVTSPIGCTIEDFYGGYITIIEKPTADFSFSPEEPNVFNTTVEFTDLSIGAESWQWDFSDGVPLRDQNPTHTFQDTGIFEITLIARHSSGCTDTMVRVIDIEPIVTFHMPNAFTPNGDASNDILIGNGFYDGLTEFKYSIWNRWGEKVFETSDPYKGWNGTKNNSGQNSPMGVYVYDVSFIDPRGDRQNLRGHATLIR